MLKGRKLFTIDGVAITGLAIFFIIANSLLLYSTKLSFTDGVVDVFEAIVGAGAAIGTIWAAIAASKSASAARDAADQWKDQMAFEKKISAGLEVISSMHYWRHMVNLARWTTLSELKLTKEGEGSLTSHRINRFRDLSKID